MDQSIPAEVVELFKNTICDKSKMNNVVHFCLEELKRVDRFFNWKAIFTNMFNLGIIDEDDGAKEFREGLCQFYDELLSEIRQVEESDLSFIGDCEGQMDKSLFHDNMIIGICLLNDVTCYNETEQKTIKLIGGCMLRKFKHDHTLERMQKLGDHSHLFDDPIDIQKRDEEAKKKEEAKAENA